MIQIEDYDTPIQVAEKIISGTKEVSASVLDKAAFRAFTGKELGEASVLDKAAFRAFTGKELGETVHRDMFELEEIKEIADYLTVYYQAHINGD